MRFKAVVDRIEGRIAVLVPERVPEAERASAAGGEPEAGCFDIPADFLPAGAKEGDVVIFDLKIDREETRERQERVQGLIDRLVEKTRRRGGSP